MPKGYRIEITNAGQAIEYTRWSESPFLAVIDLLWMYSDKCLQFDEIKVLEVVEDRRRAAR